MNVTLPDSLKDFVEQKVNKGHYASADAFVEDLVRAGVSRFRWTSTSIAAWKSCWTKASGAVITGK